MLSMPSRRLRSLFVWSAVAPHPSGPVRKYWTNLFYRPRSTALRGCHAPGPASPDPASPPGLGAHKTGDMIPTLAPIGALPDDQFGLCAVLSGGPTDAQLHLRLGLARSVRRGDGLHCRDVNLAHACIG